MLKAGEVLHLGGDRELAAGLVALQHQGLEVGAGGVERGGEAGGARAEDDDVFDAGGRGFGHGASRRVRRV